MSLPKETMDILEALAPELKESEDERIRKEIKHHISLLECYRFMDVSKEDCLAWLEKQKEPENTSASTMAPSSWSEEQGKVELVNDLKEEVKRYYSDNFTYISSDQPTLSILTNVARHFVEWQKEQMIKDAKEIITIQRSLTEPEFVKQRVIFLKEG